MLAIDTAIRLCTFLSVRKMGLLNDQPWPQRQMNTHPLITFIGGKKASSLRDIEGRVRILVAAQNCETYFGYVEFLHCVQRRGGGDHQ